jgi:hypothetical protein
MSIELDPNDIRRRAAALGVKLDDVRIASVGRLAAPIHRTLHEATGDLPFEAEPSGFAAALARGSRP